MGRSLSDRQPHPRRMPQILSRWCAFPSNHLPTSPLGIEGMKGQSDHFERGIAGYAAAAQARSRPLGRAIREHTYPTTDRAAGKSFATCMTPEETRKTDLPMMLERILMWSGGGQSRIGEHEPIASGNDSGRFTPLRHFLCATSMSPLVKTHVSGNRFSKEGRHQMGRQIDVPNTFCFKTTSKIPGQAYNQPKLAMNPCDGIEMR
jgi:hypothetical protein